MIFQNCYTQFHEPLGEWDLRQFWNITSGIYAKYHLQIMLLFVYATTSERFVIFTCRYFKFSWNTTALSQSNCRNFTCSSIMTKISPECIYIEVYLFYFSKSQSCRTRPSHLQFSNLWLQAAKIIYNLAVFF